MDWLKKPYTAIPKHKYVRDSDQVGSADHDNRNMLLSLECRCSSSFKKRIPSIDFVSSGVLCPQHKFEDDTNKNLNLP